MNFLYIVFLIQFLLQKTSPLELRLGVTTETIVAEHGYAIDKISVTTEDGYLLNMFYMPPSQDCSDNELKKPAFFMHGAGSCSDSWVLNGPDDGLPFLLVDNCHPVYLGNSRSSLYSRQHLTLNATDPRFWQYSYYELGYYDVAAMLRIIREKHSNIDINYVGHSEGTTNILVLLSERVEFNDWINTAYLLAPATYTHDVEFINPTFLKLIGCFPESRLDFPLPIMSSPLFQLFGQEVCILNSCITIPNPYEATATNLNESLIPSIGYNHPAGTAMNEFKHYLQGHCNEKYDFKKFNYGTRRNREIYGTDDPPPYYLERITSRIVIYYGGADVLTLPKYTERLCEEHPDWICTLVENYNHLDLIYALDVKENINAPIVKDMHGKRFV